MNPIVMLVEPPFACSTWVANISRRSTALNIGLQAYYYYSVLQSSEFNLLENDLQNASWKLFLKLLYFVKSEKYIAFIANYFL